MKKSPSPFTTITQNRQVAALLIVSFTLLIAAGHASAALGTLLTTFKIPASDFAVDPERPLIYATVTGSNSVAVIDTSTMSVTKIIPVGSAPQGLAISPDASTLYVANGAETVSGSSADGISVIDLNTLTVKASFATPGVPSHIAVAANGFLYATPQNEDSLMGIMQIDGTTGAFEQAFGGSEIYWGGFVVMSPDHNTLYFGNSGLSDAALISYDVSSATPAKLQEGDPGEYGKDLEISHSGAFLGYPVSVGQGANGIFEIPSANLSGSNGIFNCGAYPQNIAFNLDDSLAYTEPSGQSKVLVFNTKTFAKTGSFDIPNDCYRLTTDTSGRYLFLSEEDSQLALNSIAVYDTGTVVLTITSATSAVTQVNTAFSYQISASASSTSFNALNLPPGLSVNTATGLISGTSTTLGMSEIYLSASSAVGVATGSVILTVGNYLIPPVVASGTASGNYGESFSYPIAASGVGPITYGATGLPAGLTVDPDTGLISGTFTTAGNFVAGITGSNSAGSGAGTLTINVNGRLTAGSTGNGYVTPSGVNYLALSSTVTLTATPASGYLFQGWTGSATSSFDPIVIPITQPSMEVTANFVPGSVAEGSYSGLVLAVDPANADSGFLTLKLAKTGVYSGSIDLGGLKYPVKGLFPPANTYTITIPRKNQSPLEVTLHLDLSGQTPLITGTIGVGGFSAAVSAPMAPVYPKLSPSPRAGAYTLALYSSTNSGLIPAGTGYATVSVNKAGSVSVIGALADGTRFSSSAPINPDGTLPVYDSLYKKAGFLAGTLDFDSASSTGEIEGTLTWSKPAATDKGLYPAGFAATLDAVGSSYGRVGGIPGVSGSLAFAGGSLNPSFSQPFTLSAGHAVVLSPPILNSATFTLNAKTGLFTGSFEDSGKKQSYHGVVLQQQAAGAGYFLDSTGSGPVDLTVSP